MPGSQLVEEDCVIVIRDSDLEDVGEITRFTQWQHTLKLNDISSWQLDLQTKDFESYEIDTNTGFLFYRDGELLIDGPIMPNGIQHTFQAGVETTTIIGGCDNAYLTSRICYPVVTGPLFDTTTGNWRFGVQRSAVGIKSVITTGCAAGEEYDVPLVVADAEGFVEGNTVAWIDTAGAYWDNWDELPGKSGDTDQVAELFPQSAALTLSGVDFSTNTLTIAVPTQAGVAGQMLAGPFPAGGTIIQTSGGIVDDPAYLGYDTRVGLADDIAKELVYFNAGRGACSDHFGTRAIPHLEVGPPTMQGSTVTSNARGEALLTQVQNVCLSGGINFKTTQVGNELVFDTYLGNDLTQNGNLMFSVEMGNLKEYMYSYGPPTSNMIWGCGPETGPGKLMLPSGNQDSINQYGRWEGWISAATANAGDSASQIAANMVQTNNAALAQAIVNGSLTLTIQETDQVRYPRDFGLGDRIRIMVGTMPIDEIVTTIVYSLPGSTSSAASSALTTALTKQQTRAMTAQKAIQKQLQQMTMT